MEKRYWYQKQLRILQTVLREPDIRDYDAVSVVEYLKRTHTNCIVVNAGGIIDFFDNDTPFGCRNQFMTREDMLGDLIRECHQNAIHVIVRVDFRGVEKQRYEERPDWFGQEADGNARTGWKEIYKPCYNSYYANEHAVEFLTRMMSKYDVDGVWENSVGFGDGPCYCQRCRMMYREATGQEIPEGSDYASEEFARYRAWKAECADRHLRRMRDTVKNFGEEKAYCAEIFGMFHASNARGTGIDLYNAKEYFDFLVSPAFLDGSASPERKWDNLIYAASSMRFLKAIDDTKQAVLLCGNNGTKWRYVKAPAVETKVWMWEAAGVGACYWNCLFNGQHPAQTMDRRNQGIETEIYAYLERNEELLDGQRPKAEVGIYYSKYSRDALGNDLEAQDAYGVFIKGAETALVEAHIPYNFIPDLDFTKESLKGVKVLILPNTAWISDRHLDIIREYVREGGGLVASYETSLYDENGRRRPDFGLRDLFGVSFTGMRRDTASDCYQLIRRQHPVLEGMRADQTIVLMNEGHTLLTKAEKGKEDQVVCTYIPQIYNQPPEYAWIPEMETEFPTIMINGYGEGRVVYFANQTDKLCYTNGHEDFLDSFVNSVKWASGEKFSLEVKAPASVHVTLMEKNTDPSEKVLSFVNTTGGTVRPLREISPVYGIETCLTLEKEADADMQLMYGEGGIRFEQEGREVRIRIPELTDFAAVSVRVK